MHLNLLKGKDYLVLCFIKQYMKDEELRLRAFDALLWRYHKLYVKQCAYGGISFFQLRTGFPYRCEMG